MTNWTKERRAAQAAAIKTWRPWLKSTGPKTSRGKAIASRNSLKTGEYSKDYSPVLKQLHEYLRGRI